MSAVDLNDAAVAFAGAFVTAPASAFAVEILLLLMSALSFTFPNLLLMVVSPSYCC
jgi:hypothetical protein